MTRADWKYCEKMPDAREEFNRSVREGRISAHSTKSLVGIRIKLHDLGAELRMHFLAVYLRHFFQMKKSQ